LEDVICCVADGTISPPRDPGAVDVGGYKKTKPEKAARVVTRPFSKKWILKSRGPLKLRNNDEYQPIDPGKLMTGGNVIKKF
jgi:hypothetical protein